MIVFRPFGSIVFDRSEGLVNTVNCEGISGAGVAKEFKCMWPENYESYKLHCKRGNMKPGKICIWVIPNNTLTGPRAIFNLATKNKWQSPSKIQWVESGLKELKSFMHTFGYKSVALPALGCGNGGLPWKRVKRLIEFYLADESFHTTVYLPKGQDQ